MCGCTNYEKKCIDCKNIDLLLGFCKINKKYGNVLKLRAYDCDSFCRAQEEEKCKNCKCEEEIISESNLDSDYSETLAVGNVAIGRLTVKGSTNDGSTKLLTIDYNNSNFQNVKRGSLDGIFRQNYIMANNAFSYKESLKSIYASEDGIIWSVIWTKV